MPAENIPIEKEGQCQEPTKKSKICWRGIWKGETKGIFETLYAGEYVTASLFYFKKRRSSFCDPTGTLSSICLVSEDTPIASEMH